ncbi:hypothetical protein AMJ39_03985 [candidate division TA06 bacterium DG_24]|uniref:VWFA domain-containing protein n=3 Tax=Bacteria division TA06 TaxID=1156500 RepID=A0A0S8JMI4_UNCT6|nr:MAG: hypothetical protein AMJ39_03985 [candidate division TA06 bacterium DG_24]KPK70655.1 MAG: hypothetical protein AMJ82_02600 [candidate division TA06 bacterium SM23_40]KPL10945.1 MAG: hypothetical protein AMJ71_01360 [candidate division TA06 bacterium SM1_40]
MLPSEIIQKIRRIEIRTKRLVDDVFGGEYHSTFKGRGMEFSEVREYLPGDDVRTIDWNVTARTGHPHVKKYVEERELTIMLLVDASSSLHFGSGERSKGEVAAEICALLAFSAIRNNDRVGLIIFTDVVEKYIPPRKGRNHVLRVIRELLYFRPQHEGTDISAALEFLRRVMRKRCVAFLVSDFFASGYERALMIVSKRHDLIAISIIDRREMEMAPVGLVELEDLETGESVLADTSDARGRRAYGLMAASRAARRQSLFRSIDVDEIEIAAGASYVDPLVRFFHMRERRYR